MGTAAAARMHAPRRCPVEGLRRVLRGAVAVAVAPGGLSRDDACSAHGKGPQLQRPRMRVQCINPIRMGGLLARLAQAQGAADLVDGARARPRNGELRRRPLGGTGWLLAQNLMRVSDRDLDREPDLARALRLACAVGLSVCCRDYRAVAECFTPKTPHPSCRPAFSRGAAAASGSRASSPWGGWQSLHGHLCRGRGARAVRARPAKRLEARSSLSGLPLGATVDPDTGCQRDRVPITMRARVKRVHAVRDMPKRSLEAKGAKLPGARVTCGCAQPSLGNPGQSMEVAASCAP